MSCDETALRKCLARSVAGSPASARVCETARESIYSGARRSATRLYGTHILRDSQRLDGEATYYVVARFRAVLHLVARVMRTSSTSHSHLGWPTLVPQCQSASARLLLLQTVARRAVS